MLVPFLLFLPFFLFECISTIFFILFSLPTSTKRTIVVSFLSWKMFFCSEVLLWTHSRVQLEAPSGAKARRRSCPGRFFTGQDVEVILAIFASRPLVDPQFLWFDICVLQWLLVYREDMSGKTCVMLFRFVSLTCYELLGQLFDSQSNIFGKMCPRVFSSSRGSVVPRFYGRGVEVAPRDTRLAVDVMMFCKRLMSCIPQKVAWLIGGVMVHRGPCS